MRSAFIKWLRFFFGIGLSEAKGVILLLFFIMVISFIPLIIHYISVKEETPGKEQRIKLDSLIALLDSNLDPVKADPKNEHDTVEIQYFKFDPNNATISDFLSLGLGTEVGNRIIKYRENGGVFRKNEDLKKIYGLTDENYQKLTQYISIESDEDEVTESIEAFSKVEEPLIKELVQFDLNQVDSSELVIVNGIGKVLAGRIVRFRNSLGGFVRIDQLGEVFGLENYAFENLIKQSYIDNSFIPRKLNINSLSADSIARHPYVDFNKARVIAAYRDQHGKFQEIEDLYQIRVLDETWISRISPYLEF